MTWCTFITILRFKAISEGPKGNDFLTLGHQESPNPLLLDYGQIYELPLNITGKLFLIKTQ